MSDPANPPRLVTRRAEIRTVAARWKEQYHPGERWGECLGGAQEIHRKLLALDPETATREQVDAIIGNASWTEIRCTGCQRDVDAAVELGELPDYESATIVLCAGCLSLAVTVLKNEAAP